MFCVRLADLDILINNRYEYIKEQCKDYLVSCERPNISISVTEYEIRNEWGENDDNLGYLESLAVYRKIAEKIIEYDAFLMHAAVFEADGMGIALLAPSGVGKTTHAMLWKQMLGGKMTVINGDKPLIRVLNGVAYAYGTPWAGKENLQSNGKTVLQKVCFLERAVSNSVKPISKNIALRGLLKQVYIPKCKNAIVTILDLLEIFIETAEFFNIMCNKDSEAAITAYKGIVK